MDPVFIQYRARFEALRLSPVHLARFLQVEPSWVIRFGRRPRKLPHNPHKGRGEGVLWFSDFAVALEVRRLVLKACFFQPILNPWP
jgi:hypothetical protein